MVVNPETRERAILDLLKERYEDEGYAFFVYPSPSLVPTFLDDYRPDAIAVGREGGVIIEVTSSHKVGAEPRAKIADRFKDRDKWKYVVVYADDYPAEMLLPPPSLRDVERRLAEVEQLGRDGHLGAAFVLSWGLLEAAARLAQAPPGQPGARPDRRLSLSSPWSATASLTSKPASGSGGLSTPGTRWSMATSPAA